MTLYAIGLYPNIEDHGVEYMLVDSEVIRILEDIEAELDYKVFDWDLYLELEDTNIIAYAYDCRIFKRKQLNEVLDMLAAWEVKK